MLFSLLKNKLRAETQMNHTNYLGWKKNNGSYKEISEEVESEEFNEPDVKQ